MKTPLLWILPTLLLVVLALLGAAGVTAWLSSDSFHSLLEEKSSEALHAKASFGPLRWGWFELSSPRFQAEGLESTSLRQLEAGGLKGKLHPLDLLHGECHIGEISLENASLQIDSSRPRNNREELPGQAAPSLPAWVPKLLVIDVIRAAKADVSITLPSGNSLDIIGTHLDAYPAAEETRLEGSGGVLRNPYLPDLNVGTVRCLLKPSLVELTGADLSFPAGGSIHLDGNFPDVEESTLHGHWENVPLASLLPLLSQQLVGTVDGSGTASWNPEGIRSLEGSMKAHDVTLSNIPLLDQAAQLTGSDLLRHLPVQQAQATFSMKDGSTAFRDIVLESVGLLKLVGGGSVSAEGNLSGTFQLGMAESIASRIPGVAQILNDGSHDGYLWTSVKIGGTLAQPTEDLTPRLTAAVVSGAATNLLQGVQQILATPANQAGTPSANTNTPTTPATSPMNSTNPAKAVLDILGGVLK